MRQQLRTTDYGLRTPHRGTVLLVVLVVVTMMALIAYKYSGWMTSEYEANTSQLRSVQARALAESGVNYAAAVLSNPQTYNTLLNNNPYNNPAFQNQGSDASGPGRFTLIAGLDPGDPNSGGQGLRNGVIDEAGKLNLNALLRMDRTGQVAKQMLMAIPNMTDEVSDCILDWLDADEDPRPNGAESNYYAALSHPYQCKNGPLDTLEELLLVKGVTPQLLFGNDRNRNGIIDPDEDDGSDKTQQLGWSAYLTVHSREQDLDSTGSPRIYLNQQDLQTLSNQLTDALQNDTLVTYIMAYRQYGGSSTGGQQGNRRQGGRGNAPRGRGAPATFNPQTGQAVATGGGGTAGGGGGGQGIALNLTGGGRSGQFRVTLSRRGGGQQISSIYDLIDSQVSIPGQNGGQATTLSSPLSSQSLDTLKQYLPLLLDKTTTTRPGSTIPPRINVLTAPSGMLTNLLTAISPTVTPDEVNAIVAQRPPLSSTSPIDPIYLTPAWLITQANVKVSTVKALDRYITSRSQVYRVQVVGYFPGGGPTARIEAIIDTNAGMPRIIYWRDLTELGPGLDVASLAK